MALSFLSPSVWALIALVMFDVSAVVAVVEVVVVVVVVGLILLLLLVVLLLGIHLGPRTDVDSLPRCPETRRMFEQKRSTARKTSPRLDLSLNNIITSIFDI